MKLRLLFLLLFLIYSSAVFSQINEYNIRKIVLEKNIADSLFVFGSWEKNESEFHLKYIGIITSPEGNYKIITSVWYWGLSHRATTRILIYSDRNKYLGNYYLGSVYDIPEKIENDQLVFLHSKSTDCYKKVITRLSFEKGIPKQFFLECKDGMGDIYMFDKTD
ncbi:hypothetical protein [Flavobacterium rhizosphaerae]|uniref:Uncharacterized protein n=1 Tax=Flavobacterium rhizosphaerae TaxID=3163298 RepID=A0ABW8YX29_9FLAO